MNRELNEEQAAYYQKMQGYYDAGIVREVYATDDFALISLGELCYLIMPYMMLGAEPVGVFADENCIRGIVSGELHFWMYMKHIFSNIDTYSNIIYNMSSEKVDVWVKWVEESRPKVVCQINLELEKEIPHMAKKPEKKPGFFARLLGKKKSE